MKKPLLIALLLIACTIVVLGLLRTFKPEPEKKEAEKIVPAVEVIEVSREDVPILITSQGGVEPVTTTRIAAEVAGRITKVAPDFLAGAEFEAGDELLVIDDADYQAALAQAQANVAQAELALDTEKARSAQADRDWKKISGGKPASGLVLRKPQLKAAEATLSSAKAAATQAMRNLDRTRIVAPYDGRIAQTFTNLGSFATPGGPLAEVYATDTYEVRLPVSLDDFALLKRLGGGSEATLRATAGGSDSEWSAAIVRSEGQIDRATRSVYLVARPKGGASGSGGELLVPGLFVEASIEAGMLEKVSRIPQKAFHGDGQVLLVDAADKLRFREVQVLRVTGDDALVGEGLQPGDRVVLTSLATPLDGMEVKVVDGE